MTPSLESVLNDLDSSTADLIAADTQDVIALCKALEHRADAITKVALVLEEELPGDMRLLARLAGSLERGEQATRKALRMKQDAIEEWTRMQHLLHGLDAGRQQTRRELDYSG